MLERNPDLELDDGEVTALRLGGVPRTLTQAEFELAGRRKRPRVKEHDLQAEVVRRCLLRGQQDPAWSLVFAIPNGQYRSGQRMEAGLRAGIPDLFLPCPRGRYHGLFLELKVKPNKTTKRQEEWHARLREQGYKVVVVYDEADKALEVIEEYLAMPKMFESFG